MVVVIASYISKVDVLDLDNILVDLDDDVVRPLKVKVRVKVKLLHKELKNHLMNISKFEAFVLGAVLVDLTILGFEVYIRIGLICYDICHKLYKEGSRDTKKVLTIAFNCFDATNEHFQLIQLSLELLVVKTIAVDTTFMMQWWQ
ncbi:hypothetical protein L1987_47370 [Smallanthus sonchifolius]|uniref:Uncharacterized protein n=1 Tax=Smallanthus sonchifolius TaxID=185202 RepID=A0ACB9G2F8_9ASTR|nr:hypothetical protein L1987_47370 [Smallanthus sonchifolius]